MFTISKVYFAKSFGKTYITRN